MQSCKSPQDDFQMVLTLRVKPNSNAMVSSVGLKIVGAFKLSRNNKISIRIHIYSDLLSLKFQQMSLT